MRVLIAEDAVSLALVMADGLRERGMAVDIAFDGLEAALKVKLASYNVVVLDRRLPRLSGDMLCRQITAIDGSPMVLMLSGAASPEDRVSGLELGADDYMAKPFHFPELVLRVRALARRQPRARAHLYRVNGIELDPIRHVAFRDGRPLDLSAKEFGVLKVLLQNERCVISPEELLEQVWDEHANPFTNTVLVTISRLRRKLGGPPIIETVPGVGYRLGGSSSSLAAPSLRSSGRASQVDTGGSAAMR